MRDAASLFVNQNSGRGRPLTLAFRARFARPECQADPPQCFSVCSARLGTIGWSRPALQGRRLSRALAGSAE